MKTKNDYRLILRQYLSTKAETYCISKIGIRDIITHHYFDIDESIVFDVVKNKLSGMLQTINKMIDEL